MQRSRDRFLTTHTGSLPRPDDLIRMMYAKEEGVPVEPHALAERIRAAVAEVVKKQADAGVDLINDGEMSKPSYATYVKDRLGGFGGTGNTFVYFVQPVFSDACVAAIFLGSLMTQRPLVARLAPDFCPMHASLASRPVIQRLLRRLTLMWGLVIVAKGSLTLWLLTSLSTVNFVLVKGAAIFTLTLLAAAATVTIASIVVCRELRAMPAHETAESSSRSNADLSSAGPVRSPWNLAS